MDDKTNPPAVSEKASAGHVGFRVPDNHPERGAYAVVRCWAVFQRRDREPKYFPRLDFKPIDAYGCHPPRANHG